MKKITFRFYNKCLDLSYIFVDPGVINLEVDHNYVEKFIFEENYILNNFNLILLFVKKQVEEKKTNTFVTDNDNLLFIIFKLIENFEFPIKLIIGDNINVDNNIVDRIILNKNIKCIDCFNMDKFNLNRIIKKGIRFSLRKNIEASSDFIKQNKILNFSDVYYKEDIKIMNNFNNIDIAEFKNFCKINKELKNIYFYNFQGDNTENILKALTKSTKKNLNIMLYVDSKNIEIFKNSINNLKLLKKKMKKYKNIHFKIIYSEEYFKKNFLKQLCFLTLKTALVLMLLFTLSISSLIVYNNYKSKKDINDIKQLAVVYDEKTPKNLDNDIIENKPKKPSQNENKPSDDNKQTSYQAPTLIEDYKALLDINPDTVGWLVVKNTNVNLPIVQTTNNSFYLDNNFYKKKNYNGWAFLDYRNKLDNLDYNTIIYGHNGTIFGSLYNTLKENWFTNKDNYIITFNTVYSKMQFEIFSIYTTTPDYYYIDTDFISDDDYNSFVQDIKNHSIYDFNVEVSSSDRILTLSTCIDKGAKRVVIHAKRIN